MIRSRGEMHQQQGSTKDSPPGEGAFSKILTLSIFIMNGFARPPILRKNPVYWSFKNFSKTFVYYLPLSTSLL